MYSVMIAVCLLATPAHQCGREISVAWIVAPERPDSMGGCMRHGMLYAASSGLVTAGSYLKIFCATGQTAGAAHAGL